MPPSSATALTTAAILTATAGMAYLWGRRRTTKGFTDSVLIRRPSSAITPYFTDLRRYFLLCEFPGERYTVLTERTTAPGVVTFRVRHELRGGRVIETECVRARTDHPDGITTFVDTFPAMGTDITVRFVLEPVPAGETRVTVHWSVQGVAWKAAFFRVFSPRQIAKRISSLKAAVEATPT